jgi:hypothetical protein
MTGLSPPAERRSQTVVGKLLRAERMIEFEIQRNAGVYPFNGGRLSEGEVCRRAGIKRVTLQGTAHATTTRVQVSAWLRKTADWMAGGAEPLNGNLAKLGDAWKAQLEQIAVSYHVANLEVAMLRKRIRDLEQRERALAEKQVDLNAAINRDRPVGRPR